MFLLKFYKANSFTKHFRMKEQGKINELRLKITLIKIIINKN